MLEDKKIKGYRKIETVGKVRFLEEPNQMPLPIRCNIGTVNGSSNFEVFIPTLKIKIILQRVDLVNLLGEELKK